VEWTEFNETYVLGAMPTDVRAAYDKWLAAHPEKSGRLVEIIGQVVADFRSGLSANPNVVMEPGDSMLAERCVPHALTVVIYYLMLEMGMAVNMSAQTAFNNAQVYLRKLYTSDEVVDGAGVSRSPSYETGIEREARVIGCA
jgi:hypothetical protein